MSATWKPTHLLEGGTNLKPGWWTMQDRGRVIGYIERIKHEGRWVFRGWTPDQLWILGYELSLAAAARTMWEWDHETRGPSPQH